MKKKHPVRKTILIVLTITIVTIPLYMLVSGYINSLPKLKYTYGINSGSSMVAYPNTQFAVISDLHYYDNSLGTTGSAFEACLNSDRKLIRDSSDLISYAVNEISNSGVKFVLVTGDLTKDGELIDHQMVSAALSKLTQKGIKVYVIPGNHDINNPGSVSYSGDKTTPVANVSALQFADIYSSFGYSSAIMRDTGSLSYVAEPTNNLWIVALDTCRYVDNKAGGEETIGGRLTQSQETWLEGVLKKAQQQGKAVIVMSHHGIIEHWVGQSKLHPDYLISDYKYIGKMLASYDVRLSFTGHYHAQDITLSDFNKDGFLYDIETGSLVTAPCPIRYCTIANNKIEIKSDDIVDKIHPSTDFAKNANAFVKKTIYNEAYKTLRKYLVSEKDSSYISDYVSAAFSAHYSGDEDPSQRPSFDENKLSLWGKIIYANEKYVIDGLWKDLPPADNNCLLDLSKR